MVFNICYGFVKSIQTVGRRLTVFDCKYVFEEVFLKFSYFGSGGSINDLEK